MPRLIFVHFYYDQSFVFKTDDEMLFMLDENCTSQGKFEITRKSQHLAKLGCQSSPWVE